MGILEIVEDIWDYIKAVRSKVNQIWDIAENRFMLRNEGIDTWIGRIFDTLDDLKEEALNKLTYKNEGLDTWIGKIYDEVVSIEAPIVDIDFTEIVSQLSNIQTAFQSGVNAILSQFNQSILNLKAEFENYVSDSMTTLTSSLEHMFQQFTEQLTGIADIDLSNLPQSFVEALTSSFDIDEEQLTEILEVRFPSG